MLGGGIRLAAFSRKPSFCGNLVCVPALGHLQMAKQGRAHRTSAGLSGLWRAVRIVNMVCRVRVYTKDARKTLCQCELVSSFPRQVFAFEPHFTQRMDQPGWDKHVRGLAPRRKWVEITGFVLESRREQCVLPRYPPQIGTFQTGAFVCQIRLGPPYQAPNPSLARGIYCFRD